MDDFVREIACLVLCQAGFRPNALDHVKAFAERGLQNLRVAATHACRAHADPTHKCFIQRHGSLDFGHSSILPY